ncbi:MAG: hypothetical protein WC816_01930 [Sphingomonas sp.]|jgi:membrane protein YqaA with SNARE-associated domain
MMEYAVLFAIVLGINLMPALGPPTWSVIVIYELHTHIPLVALVLISALAAASGRLLLALGFRYLRGYVPARTMQNLVAAGELVEHRKRGAVLALGLFALSPVPSAQLFEAAGLMGVRLLKFTTVFFLGRVVSYSIYGATATRIAATSVGDAFQRALVNPVGIAIEVGMIALLMVLAQIDWAKRFGRPRSRRP